MTARVALKLTGWSMGACVDACVLGKGGHRKGRSKRAWQGDHMGHVGKRDHM
jgi:hypothetical protein